MGTQPITLTDVGGLIQQKKIDREPWKSYLYTHDRVRCRCVYMCCTWVFIAGKEPLRPKDISLGFWWCGVGPRIMFGPDWCIGLSSKNKLKI